MPNEFKLLFYPQIVYWLFGRYRLYNSQFTNPSSPFFILGSGRNGSTLLSMILNGHPKLFIPPEQYALHYAAVRFKLYNFLMWKDLVKIIIGEFADSNNSEDWNINFSNLYSSFYNLPKNQRTFQSLVDKIVAEYANQNGEEYELWGDKSPSTIWFLKTIFNVYPQSKYLFLIRDGRDVVSSYKLGGREIFGDLANIEKAAINWCTSIEKWRWLKKKANPEQLLEVRYENLIEEPQQVIKEISSFLRIPYEKSILNYEKVILKRKEINRPQYKNLQNPLNSNSIGLWKGNLTNQEIFQISPILNNGLREYNYL